MRETSGSEKAQEIFQAPVEQAGGFTPWRERLDRDLHILLSRRFKIAQAHPRNIMQGKVGIDQHQSVRVAHQVGALLAEYFHQASASFSNFLFRFLAENGMPVSDRPRPC